ncbi:MAG: hypothetical protein EB830_06690 [Nitrosopumilus sp. H13]|nr:MAG: hypothetical protein EB830_06690 [Nitrosopumilus sp. H13]
MQMIRAPKSPMSGATLGNNGLGDIQHWPFIQTFEMAAGDQMGIAYGAGAPDIVVTYNDPAGDSTFEFDRESYPRDSDVRMTIRDMQLNVDPTSEDLWTFDVDGSGEIYRRLFDGMGNLVKTDKEDIDPGQIYHYGAINGAKVYDMVLVSGPPGTDAIRTVDNSLQDSTQVPTIAGSLVTVRETAANSGIFENTDRLGAANLRTGSDDGILEFKAGYYDQGRYTGAFAGGMLGGDSLQRARISDPGLVDASGGKLGAISAGQQVLITSTISGYAGLDQTFTFLLKIQDKDGATVHLGWLAGRLAGAQEFEPALSWTPPAPGTYTATVFLWESIESPTALSSPKSIEITAT